MSNPRFPIYLPSKGRASICMTMKVLNEMNVPYRVVVERQERDAYTAALGEDKILVLDPTYQDNYDTFDDLGRTKSLGPGPARNFIWEHSIGEGHDWHWVMDDNIFAFGQRTPRGKVYALDGTMFRLMEDFVLRYRNVGMAGPHYHGFVTDEAVLRRPYVLNTRIYSCNLIRNDLPIRWRGRYNEDTDLSLRMLKTGWCTVQFYGFLQYKLATQVQGGGNTAEFYSREGTGPKSRMLYTMHPDVTRIVGRFNRIHHQVDYRPFQKLKLLRDPAVTPTDTGNKDALRLTAIPKGITGRRSPEFWQNLGITRHTP